MNNVAPIRECRGFRGRIFFSDVLEERFEPEVLVKMHQKLGKFLFRVNFNGFLLGLDKLALFKPCLPGT